MTSYTAIEKATGRVVHEGDTVTDFRGDTAVFVRVTRGELPGKSAKVLVREEGDTRPGAGREYYERVFGLEVVVS